MTFKFDPKAIFGVEASSEYLIDPTAEDRELFEQLGQLYKELLNFNDSGLHTLWGGFALDIFDVCSMAADFSPNRNAFLDYLHYRQVNGDWPNHMDLMQVGHGSWCCAQDDISKRGA